MTIQNDIEKAKIYRNRKQGGEFEFFDRIIDYMEELENWRKAEAKQDVEYEDQAL